MAALVVLVVGLFAFTDKLDIPTATPVPATATDRLDVPAADTTAVRVDSTLALEQLAALEVKGRGPKTGDDRAEFGDGWATEDGCGVRNQVLARDLVDVTYQVDDGGGSCIVEAGTLNDPYTGEVMEFVRGPDTSSEIHIDHVVSLSDAWQKGAQYWAYEDRVAFANDPTNLLAVAGAANQAKGDGDAATWLPPDRSFRCQSVIKDRHRLLDQAEKSLAARVAALCELRGTFDALSEQLRDVERLEAAEQLDTGIYEVLAATGGDQHAVEELRNLGQHTQAAVTAVRATLTDMVQQMTALTPTTETDTTAEPDRR